MSIHSISYRSPFWIRNGHWETIYPHQKRKLSFPVYDREQLELEDGDFLLLDWLKQKKPDHRLLICSHGLEGSSNSLYARAMALQAHRDGWDFLAWNNRSCGGKMNRLPRLYFHGSTYELNSVIDHSIRTGYTHITLVGFSMGGSINLKWTGTHQKSEVKASAVLSSPLELRESAESLDDRWGWLYRDTFLKKLSKKLKNIRDRYPDLLDWKPLDTVNNWKTLDEKFSAPMLGYADLKTMYHEGSARRFSDHVQVPTLVINALNDPLIGKSSYDIPEWENHAYIRYEITRHGGHVGWMKRGSAYTWAEKRVWDYLKHH